MNGRTPALPLAALALAASLVPGTANAADPEARVARAQQAAARQAVLAERRQRAARIRWERDRRSAAAHARMPSTMYASTPSPPDADPHCPVPRDAPAGPSEDVYDRIIRERDGGGFLRPSSVALGKAVRALSVQQRPMVRLPTPDGAAADAGHGPVLALVASTATGGTQARNGAAAGTAGSAHRDCPTCPRMVDVPAGSFEMGSPSTEALRSTDEGPRRLVEFPEPFALGETEVTFAEWQACVDDGGCGGYVPADAATASGDRPATDVTWAQARSYAEWLSTKTGLRYRLPSEAEWEYAARAGTTTPFHTGATVSTDQANYDGTLPPYGDGVAGEFRGATVAVGSFAPNAFGLRDMHGNVAEWTADCHAPDHQDSPTDGTAADSADCAERVLRGGSWRDGPEELRSANRTAAADGWYGATAGFRVAKDLSAPSGGEGTAADVFRESVSAIVQSKCVNCHVEGGRSGNTRLVFVRDDDADHLAKNLAAFETFVSEVDGGADMILTKIQGVDHGGGLRVAAGTDEFAAMERFVGLLGGGTGGGTSITPATLFDVVTMESWRSTLRRAAIVFAGRIPTEAEYASIKGGTGDDLRAAIRGLMTGSGFHEFLIRGANDRLLTDREVRHDILFDFFLDYQNTYYDLLVAAAAGDNQGEAQRALEEFQKGTRYGVARAPLELIAHVVENELPYTDVLTADYIMANPVTADAYGAETEFADVMDVHDFQPSTIASYYREDDSKVTEDTQFGQRIIDPGNLTTDYPHAGVLNTTAFLKRYPSTATNRNRARSRWTYYHFLGRDIEKSASRTTDSVALADTNNPTMHNPACTVCHTVMDPVAGAFQNYGDEGGYRDKWGGMDSLDEQYKEGAGNLLKIAVAADDYASREAFSHVVWLDPGSRLVLDHSHNNGCGEDENETCGRDLRIDDLHIRGLDGRIVDHIEWSELDQHCEHDGEYEAGSGDDDHYRWWGWGCHDIPVDVPESGNYVLGITLWADQADGEVTSFRLGANLYQIGDTWYRDMRTPGFDGEPVPDADNSLQWLAEEVVADPRFAEATVKFWWPAIMGAEVAESPSEGDADFEGRLLAFHAQSADVKRLAGGFRRGFRGGDSYDLKDLLTEMVLSPWFRADALADGDPVRAVALRAAGARRLLTPEELSRKTVALTGFDWLRDRRRPWMGLDEAVNWTNADIYGLLYGGIDSDGITERGRDLTSVMVGVAQRHANAVACPVVMKELYLLPDEDRRLLGGVTPTVSPLAELHSAFDVEAASDDEKETLTLAGRLSRGSKNVRMSYVNDYCCEGGDRNIRLDRLVVTTASGTVVSSHELEEMARVSRYCEPDQGSYWLAVNCTAVLPVEVPTDGVYSVDIVAWGEQAAGEYPRLVVTVESETPIPSVERDVRTKLVELHEKLLGAKVDAMSADVQDAYDLFVAARHRSTEAQDGDDGFGSVRCDWQEDVRYLDGIVDDAVVWREDWDWGEGYGWDQERIDRHFDTIDWTDDHGVARAWVVVLAYLMTDPRYLHL